MFLSWTRNGQDKFHGEVSSGVGTRFVNIFTHSDVNSIMYNLLREDANTI